MFYVERLESYHGLRFSSRVSRLRPIHLTSSGKAVAAFNPAVAEAACAAGFVPRTPRSIRTRSSSCAAWPRPGGGATPSIEEDEPGLASVAAPVLDRTGVARAAISVAGPVTRVSETHIGQMARRVQAAASQLMSVEIGVVERLRLPLTWFARAERSFAERGTFVPLSGHSR